MKYIFTIHTHAWGTNNYTHNSIFHVKNDNEK